MSHRKARITRRGDLVIPKQHLDLIQKLITTASDPRISIDRRDIAAHGLVALLDRFLSEGQ